MKPYYQSDSVRIFHGDCRDVLKRLPAESVHCVVTSPPYWGLRTYHSEPLIWGGAEDCDHVWAAAPAAPTKVAMQGVTETVKHPTLAAQPRPEAGQRCQLCGAWAGELGLEPTPDEYVEHMVEVFREVRRVLREDGTVWLNLGDSYASGKGSCFNPGGGLNSLGQRRKAAGAHPLNRGNKSGLDAVGLKPKDLVGIPWRCAFALQADGWWLRCDIIWHKPNPLPESVGDRPTKAHEYVFLLTKSQRYYYDAEAIREPNSEGSIERFGIAEEGQTRAWNTANNKRDNREDGTKSAAPFRGHVPTGRNRRSVWQIATQPYHGAHFATFPEALVEPCVLAGTSERGCCPECGAPWVRVTERTNVADASAKGNRFDVGKTGANGCGRTQKGDRFLRVAAGWRPTCRHDLEPVPCLVLDPFHGSGTTGRVAVKHRRRYVGIELNVDYIALDRADKTQVVLPMVRS